MVAFKFYKTLIAAENGYESQLEFLHIPFNMARAEINLENEIDYYICGTGYWAGSQPQYKQDKEVKGSIPLATLEQAIQAFEALIAWDKSQGILDLTQYQKEGETR